MIMIMIVKLFVVLFRVLLLAIALFVFSSTPSFNVSTACTSLACRMYPRKLEKKPNKLLTNTERGMCPLWHTTYGNTSRKLYKQC
jgi:hypothetical protein